MNKHLLFLTDGVIPSKRAGTLHVLNLIPFLAKKVMQLTLVSQGLDKSDELKLTHYPVKIPSFRGKLFILMARFRSAIKKINPDLIYSRFVLLPLVSTKTPFIIEVHDDFWNKSILHKWAFARANKSKNSLGYIAITAAIKEAMEVADTNCPTIEVIPDAGHLPNPDYQPVFNDRMSMNIAYLGSFHKGKGLEIILPLAKALPEHKFILIGDAGQDTIDAIKQLEVNNIELTGFIDQREVWLKMADVDICLLPNQPNVQTGRKSNIGQYTSPLKMFEYMAYSKPIIASNLEVLKEVLDQEIAVFAAHDRLEDWIAGVELLKNPKVRKTMGEKAFDRFIKNYTWEKRAERILAFANRQLNEQ